MAFRESHSSGSNFPPSQVVQFRLASRHPARHKRDPDGNLRRRAWATDNGHPVQRSAAIRFIALFDIAVMDGNIILPQYNLLIDEGLDGMRAAIRTGELQLRPVLTTCIIAGIEHCRPRSRPGSDVRCKSRWRSCWSHVVVTSGTTPRVGGNVVFRLQALRSFGSVRTAFQHRVRYQKIPKLREHDHKLIHNAEIFASL